MGSILATVNQVSETKLSKILSLSLMGDEQRTLPITLFGT